MIKEAIERVEIQERRVKPLAADKVRSGMLKLAVDIAKKNHKKWYKDENDLMDAGIMDEKDYLDYIIEVLGMFMESAVNQNNLHGESKTQLYMEFDGATLAMTLGSSGWWWADMLIEEMSKIDFKDFLEKRGYYIGNASIYKETIHIIAHGNYDEPMKVGESVFHIMDKKYVKDALKNGLKPRNGDKLSHDLPRVYCTTTIQSADEIFRLLSEWEVYNIPKMKKKVLIEIDTSKLRKGTKFYTDLNFKPNGCWTYSHIPAEALFVVEEYDLL